MTEEWPTENLAREPRSLQTPRSQKEYKPTAGNLREDANEQYRLQNPKIREKGRLQVGALGFWVMEAVLAELH